MAFSKPGRKSAKEKTVVRTFVVAESLNVRIDDFCEANGITKSAFVQRAVIFYFNTLKNLGFVYLWRDPLSGFYKIGKSKDPEHRLEREFNAKLPFEFELIHKIESVDYTRTERLLHNFYENQKKRRKGEWFELTEEDVDNFLGNRFKREILDSIYGIDEQVTAL